MDTQQYQEIKDLAMSKVQQRLNATPGIKEDLVRKFTDWFQELVLQAKEMQAQAQVPMPEEGGEGAMPPPAEGGM